MRRQQRLRPSEGGKMMGPVLPYDMAALLPNRADGLVMDEDCCALCLGLGILYDMNDCEPQPCEECTVEGLRVQNDRLRNLLRDTEAAANRRVTIRYVRGEDLASGDRLLVTSCNDFRVTKSGHAERVDAGPGYAARFMLRRRELYWVVPAGAEVINET